jgi:site-specific DNA recombinase
MKQYPGQERRLMQAFKMGFTPDIVLDEINQTKKEKEADQSRLASLLEAKRNLVKAVDYEAKLKELCTRIVPDLDNCTNQDKKDAYTYLDLKVTAAQEGVDIKGYVPSFVLSNGQLSGCLPARTPGCLPFRARRI